MESLGTGSQTQKKKTVTNQEISVDSPESSSWIPAIPSLLPLLQPLMSDILQPIWCTSFPSKANYCFTHQLLIVMAWIHIFFSGTRLLSSATHLYMKYLGTPCSASAAMSICLWSEPHRVLKATTNGRVIRTANTVFFWICESSRFYLWQQGVSSSVSQYGLSL